MLTQCPNCDTTFRVTSEILRVAQGQVRCGRCDTQFDALERLLEEDELVDDDADTQEAAALDADDLQLSEPDLEEEPEQLEAAQFEEEQFEEQQQDEAASPEEETQAEEEEWVEFEDIDAESEIAADADDVEDLDADAAEAGEAQADAADYESGELDDFEEEAAARPSAAGRAYAGEWRGSPQPASGRSAIQYEDTDQFSFNKPRHLPGAAIWKYLAAPLIVLFMFQVFNHYRAPLARHPRFGSAVSGMYRLLGVDLIPDWNLRAYEIKNYRVASDPTMPGTLRVRAIIRNRASFPQPYPLLRLILLDRFTDPVRAREFEPIEYLEQPPAPNARLAPRNEFVATFTIVDPGPDAPGFRFDICLRGNNGPVCTEDLPMVSP